MRVPAFAKDGYGGAGSAKRVRGRGLTPRPTRVSLLFLIALLSSMIGQNSRGQGSTNAAVAPPTGVRKDISTMAALTPPIPKPPVELFRELLAMDPTERRAALANRTAEDRDSILAKVREYLSLKPDQQALRLHATELSWYLTRLMRTPATNRAVQLAQVPDLVRTAVEDRLQVWDKLAPEVRKEFVDNRLAAQYFTEVAAGIPQPAMTNISSARSNALNKGVLVIQAMPEAQRQKLLTRFKEFFDLTPAEKQSVLTSISEPERQAMEKTLSSFGKLTPEQRSACIHSFEKFAGMSIAERNQFLKNAERWKLMTPQQRQTWREVVSEVVLLPTVSDTPPIPRAVPPRRVPPPIVTNGP